MYNTNEINFIETLTSSNERSFTMTLQNSIYDYLNNYDLDVSVINTVYKSKDAFGNLYKKVIIEIVQMCNLDAVDAFKEWHTLAKENDFRNGPDSTIFTSGTLLVHGNNHGVTKTYKLADLLPESLAFGNAYKNNSMVRLTLSGYMWELANEQNKDTIAECTCKTDSAIKKESLMIDISDIKKVVDMIKDISNLTTTITENDELYSESFLDALEDYHELLKQQCTDFIITSLLNK